MRLDTYSFRHTLTEELENSGVHIEYDGGDLLMLQTPQGKAVEIHIVERPISLDEVRFVFTKNSDAGVYTLYLLWCDLLLPDNGHEFRPEPWLMALHAAHNGAVYGYKAYGDMAFIFPVMLERVGLTADFVARYRRAIEIGNLHPFTITLDTAFMKGVWYAVDFSADEHVPGEERSYEYKTLEDDLYKEVVDHYRVLGLDKTADKDTIRRVYRQLARLYHPDLNSTREATARMQQINESYRVIMTKFEDDSAA